MSYNVTSKKISNNLTVNTIPNYPAEMVILKVYVYARPWFNNKGYDFLTLFSMVPVNEYQTEVDTFESAESTWPKTNGVFVNLIGSVSGLITTHARIGLRTYQDHLEQNGWCFLDTVPGMKGVEYETARKMAFAHIQRMKKNGINIPKKENDSKDLSFIKDVMKGHIDDIIEINNHHGNFTAALEKLTTLIDNL